MRSVYVVLASAVFSPVVTFGQTPSAATAVEQSGPQAHALTRAEFDALLAKPEQLLIVDLRRPDEIASVGGFSVFLSVQPNELEKSLALIPRDRTVVTVSNRVRRSGEAAVFLASHGFNVAGALGARSYEEQGGTLVKIAPPAP